MEARIADTVAQLRGGGLRTAGGVAHTSAREDEAADTAGVLDTLSSSVVLPPVPVSSVCPFFLLLLVCSECVWL